MEVKREQYRPYLCCNILSDVILLDGFQHKQTENVIALGNYKMQVYLTIQFHFLVKSVLLGLRE